MQGTSLRRVYGGHFVIVTDDTSAVTYHSVVQNKKIEGVGTVPKLSQSAAEKIATAHIGN